jgi:translation elongation factor EF-4
LHQQHAKNKIGWQDRVKSVTHSTEQLFNCQNPKRNNKLLEEEKKGRKKAKAVNEFSRNRYSVFHLTKIDLK